MRQMFLHSQSQDRDCSCATIGLMTGKMPTVQHMLSRKSAPAMCWPPRGLGITHGGSGHTLADQASAVRTISDQGPPGRQNTERAGRDCEVIIHSQSTSGGRTGALMGMAAPSTAVNGPGSSAVRMITACLSSACACLNLARTSAWSASARNCSQNFRTLSPSPTQAAEASSVT
jgi:hypothetical protein